MTGANAKIKRIYVGDKQVRPGELVLKQIFDFSTSDNHGFTYRNTGANGLKIDTTNRYCTNNNSGYGCYYKQVNYKKCWQRIMGMAGGTARDFSLICGIGNNYAPSSGYTCSLGYNGAEFFIGIKGQSGYILESLPSGFYGTQWHYYDTIWDNGNVTVRVLDLNENIIFSKTYTASETTQKYIGFSGGSTYNRMYIKEYRLAYEE